MSKGSAKDLVGTAASFASVAASGAYTSSGKIKLGGARKLTLFIAYKANASGGDLGLLSVLPLFSAAKTIEAQLGNTDDAWFAPGVWDGTVSPGTLTAASLPAGTDFDVQPDWGRALHRALDIRTEPADGNSDDIRITVTLDVSPYLWCQLLYAEAGDTTNQGTCWISYVLHA